jgi:cytochrome P450
MTALPAGPRLPRPLQLAGWVTRPGPFMTRMHERYGDVFTLRAAPGEDWVMLSHPDAVREVFQGSADDLHAGEANAILEPIVGRRSVLLLDGREHLRDRRMMLPPFHGDRLARYGELMAGVARREAERWPVGEPLALWPRMQAITLEIICRAVFGVTEPAALERFRVAIARMLAQTIESPRMFLIAILADVVGLGEKGFERALAPVHALLDAEIAARRADPDTAERDDILSLLLQARDADGNGLTDSELRDELLTLLVAGHETTATSLAWTLERLMRHDGALERATEDKAYREAAVREALRLRPVLPIVLRKLTRDMTIAGHDLPAGCFAAPCIFLLHRRPDLYPDPLAFRPERFLETPPGTYTWIPFGGGVRRCLGASFALFEMDVVLEQVLRHARLRAPAPGPERISRRAITLTPAEGAVAVRV